MSMAKMRAPTWVQASPRPAMQLQCAVAIVPPFAAMTHGRNGFEVHFHGMKHLKAMKLFLLKFYY